MIIRWVSLSLMVSLGAAPLHAQTCPSGNTRVAPAIRYTNHGNGTVTDIKTGLMWKQCSEGQSGSNCAGMSTRQTWTAALALAANSNFAGFGDWRLPSFKELHSLVETGCYSPSINSELFPNTIATYWSATPFVVNDGLSAWFVDFFDGYTYWSWKTTIYSVRLVRDQE